MNLSMKRCGPPDSLRRYVKRILPLAVAVAGASLLGGCAHSFVETRIGPDGGWKRKAEFRVAAADQQKGPESIGMNPSLKLEDFFVLPSGPGWKVKKAAESGQKVYTVERTLRPGEELEGDVVLKGEAAKSPNRLSNRVSIHRAGLDLWEYREVLRWTGEKPKAEEMIPEPEMARVIKKSLPPALANDEDARRMGRLFTGEMIKVLFGPPEPMFEQILFNPAFASLQMSRQLGRALPAALAREFGNRLTPAERAAVARRFIREASDMMSQTQKKVKSRADPMSQAQPSSNSMPLTLTFSVRLPGKVVATNGLTDPLENTVSWSLYDFAVALDGEVTLRAVCKVDAPQGGKKAAE
ncbi:MAG: hypothetical protein IT210_15405 [Armatimonadetes bacterium]|nr:hypothetical protein [Armatimonadota bacterium]